MVLIAGLRRILVRLNIRAGQRLFLMPKDDAPAFDGNNIGGGVSNGNGGGGGGFGGLGPVAVRGN